jgi:transcriptional repressor NrdR
MVCPYCKADTAVVNSRHQKRSNSVWRRRTCLDCVNTFTTTENMQLSTVLSVSANKRITPFNEDYLFAEILGTLPEANNNAVTARELTNTVISILLKDGAALIDSRRISIETLKVLKRYDAQAWHAYIAKHPSLIN